MKPFCGWRRELKCFVCFQWNSVMELETLVGNTARQNGSYEGKVALCM